VLFPSRINHISAIYEQRTMDPSKSDNPQQSSPFLESRQEIASGAGRDGHAINTRQQKMDSLDEKQPAPSTSPETLVPAASSAVTAERSTDLQQEIDAAVDELRTEYKEVFILFHTEEIPYETIGSMMQKPVGTIKTWLHRARLAVVERLRERGVVYSGSTPPHD